MRVGKIGASEHGFSVYAYCPCVNSFSDADTQYAGELDKESICFHTAYVLHILLYCEGKESEPRFVVSLKNVQGSMISSKYCISVYTHSLLKLTDFGDFSQSR